MFPVVTSPSWSFIAWTCWTWCYIIWLDNESKVWNNLTLLLTSLPYISLTSNLILMAKSLVPYCSQFRLVSLYWPGWQLLVYVVFYSYKLLSVKICFIIHPKCTVPYRSPMNDWMLSVRNLYFVKHTALVLKCYNIIKSLIICIYMNTKDFEILCFSSCL